MKMNPDNYEMKEYTVDVIANMTYTAEFDSRMDEDEVYDHLRNQAEEYLRKKEFFYFENSELEELENFREGSD